MGGTLAELVVSIVAQTKEFDKTVKETKKKTTELETGFKKATTNIKNLIGGIAVGALVLKLGQVATEVIDLASDAQETRSKFETAFEGITTEADAVATSLVDNYGLSQTAAENLLGSTADLVKGFGATSTEALDTSAEIQALSVDLASYNNLQGGASRASEILTKAYLGERDSLVSLGIKISEADVKQRLLEKGQQDLTGQALLLAKGQATLELATQQSGDALGDFARTSDSYANQLKVAKARTEDLGVELGRVLLPTASTVTEIFGELTGKLATYLKRVNDIRVAEKARELGIATRQQEILLLTEQIKNNEKLIDQEKQQLDLSEDQESITGKLAEDNIRLIELQTIGLQKKLGELTGTIEKESQLLKLQEENEEQTRKQEAQEELLQKLREEAYDDAISGINDIIESDKSEIDVLDEKIEKLQELETTDKEANEARLEALEILTEQRKEILDTEAAEEKARLEAETLAEQEFFAELDRLAEEKKLKDAERREADRLANAEKLTSDLETYQGYAESVLGIIDNIYQTQLNVLDAESQAKIDALDADKLGEEEYATAVEAIKKETAEKKYEIELKQFNLNKALALGQIAIDTAAGIIKAYSQLGVFAIPSAILIGAAGTAQAIAVGTQQPPPPPAFATGGVVTGATQAIVGEDGGEVMLGMGAKGAPLINELADRIAERQGSGITINLNGNGIFSKRDLDNFAEKLYSSNIKAQQRRGIY